MPTPDHGEPRARAPRRPLGRGPGATSACPRTAEEKGQDPPLAEGTPPEAENGPSSGDGAPRHTIVAPDPDRRGHGESLHDDGSAPPRSADAESARHARPAGAPASVESRTAKGSAGTPGPGPHIAEQRSRPAGERAGTKQTDPTGGDAGEDQDDGRFTVRLDNFEGPFDLLLQLISKHKLDVTEVALSKVTDEFMDHIHAMGPDWDLDQTTEFLVVAATLLDLKAARLLPAAEVEDEADLALLEARDLLFARLLQYRAYKRVADIFAGRLAAEARSHPRTVGLEPHHADLLPEVALSIGPEGFARLAVKAMQPKPKPQVYVEHIHAPLVSVREQAEVMVSRLRELGETAFRTLIEDAPDTLTIVARFLALLELYRERAVTLEQPEALGKLIVCWTGSDEAGPVVTDEFDQVPAPRQDPAPRTNAEPQKEAHA
jgi:segregation and condensation protein A